MNHIYYSDRMTGHPVRDKEEINATIWQGIWSYVQGLLERDAFARDFPTYGDYKDTNGTNIEHFKAAYGAEIPRLIEALANDDIPPTLAILDFLEFCYQHVTKAEARSSLYDGLWLAFDDEAGQNDFREKINLIFSRNHLAYELTEKGSIEHLANPILNKLLKTVVFYTGNSELDHFLQDAQSKFLSPDPKLRRESINILWRAWESVKTLEAANKNQKSASADSLLEAASPDAEFYEVLKEEAKSLTKIGNDFDIRHSETYKPTIKELEQVDYLFHRMFALIYLILQKRGATRELDQGNSEEIPF